MIRKRLTRRKLLASAAAIGSFAIIGRASAATPYKPSDSLVEAARKEGKFVLYTATFTEVEQEVINEFRKKFPFIRVEMIRAPGGQLIQRVKTEAAAGVTKTAANPNAAKLFLNWCMSEEGQEFQIKELGYLTALKNPPLNPPGYDPKVIKAWAPNFEQYVKLRDQWVEEWNKVYGYRQ